MTEVDRIVKQITIDENFQKEVADLVKEGWTLETPAVAIYHLIRPKQQVGAIGKMKIRDDLISVRGPDGELKQ